MPRSTASPFNSWDAIKVIALLLMFVDHAGNFLFPDQLWLRAIGRGAAPIFLYLAGFAASYRFKWDLFWLAAAMTAFNIAIGEYTHPLNILFAILLWRQCFAWLEKRGRKIERPFEWYVSALVFIPTSIFVVEYGTGGFMLAICGYLKRRSQYYSQKLQHGFMLLVFITHGALQAWLFQFTLGDTLLMIPILYAVYLLLWRFDIHDINTSHWPSWLARLLKLMSYYSGYIYAIHLIILGWIAHMPI